MFAQVLRASAGPGRCVELDRAVHDHLLPALRGEAGFSGAFNLVDAVTGDSIAVVFWETEEQAARPVRARGERLRQTLATVRRLSCGGQQVSIWEVSARA